MSLSHRKKVAAVARFHEWLLTRLEQNRSIELPAPGPTEVTLLTYFFLPKNLSDEHFLYLEGAIRETWRQCGLLTTVIVTNEITDAMRAFAEPFGRLVELQEEKSLIHGRLNTMSIDCNARLADRFHTRYVLLITEDGFPIRPGIGRYMDGIDFWGSPVGGDNWISRLRAHFFNCHEMLGSFSLRSKRLCRMVQEQWNQQYCKQDFTRDLYEARFCTHTLPLRSYPYRKEIQFPSVHEAALFSFDSTNLRSVKVMPFGFSGVRAFRILEAQFKL